MVSEVGKKEWPVYTVGAGVIAAVLCFFMGSITVFYAVGLLGLCLLCRGVAQLFRS
jgi:uncharacterized membrane protein HdeD (DUF308 family)